MCTDSTYIAAPLRLSGCGSLYMDEQRLTDTALKIYIHMLESDTPLTAREIARSLNIPVSTVSYYLKKFKDAGIVREVGGGYVVARRIRIEGFVYVGGKLIPRLLLYAFFFAGLLIGEAALLVGTRSADTWTVIALLSTAMSAGIFLYEGLKARRKLFA